MEDGMTRLFRMLPIGGIAVALLGALPAAGRAQPVPESIHVPVLVVMPQPAAGLRPEIVVTRRPSEGYRIVIPRHLASPQNLQAGVRKVSELLNKDGADWRDQRVYVVVIDRAAARNQPASLRLYQHLMRAESQQMSDTSTAATIIYLVAPRPK
jgi:hypothetical protein